MGSREVGWMKIWEGLLKGGAKVNLGSHIWHLGQSIGADLKQASKIVRKGTKAERSAKEEGKGGRQRRMAMEDGNRGWQ
jgi:hypothetical protein